MSRRAESAQRRANQHWASVLLLLLCTCAKSNMPASGSETHFLVNCASSCPTPYTCACGVCTLSCSNDQMCAAQHTDAVCNHAASTDACRTPTALCDVTCRDDRECASLGDTFGCYEGQCRQREGREGVVSVDPAPDSSTGTGNEAGSSTQDSGPAPSDAGALMSDADAMSSEGGAVVPDVICDGSDSVRLGLSSGGGFVDESYFFTNPYGSSFLFVDGKCRFYTLSSDLLAGVHSGVLTTAQAGELAAAIGWSKLGEWSKLPEDLNCPDGGTTTIRRLGAASSCSCGCDPTAPAEQKAAFEQVYPWLQRLFTQGAALTGPVSAIALRAETVMGNEFAWPLSTRVTAIPGLVVTAATGAMGARFDLSTDAAKLRTLREQARARGNLGTPDVPVVDAGSAYRLHVRDELPTAFVQGIDALLKSSP